MCVNHYVFCWHRFIALHAKRAMDASRSEGWVSEEEVVIHHAGTQHCPDNSQLYKCVFTVPQVLFRSEQHCPRAISVAKVTVL